MREHDERIAAAADAQRKLEEARKFDELAEKQAMVFRGANPPEKYARDQPVASSNASIKSGKPRTSATDGCPESFFVTATPPGPVGQPCRFEAKPESAAVESPRSTRFQTISSVITYFRRVSPNRLTVLTNRSSVCGVGTERQRRRTTTHERGRSSELVARHR